MKHSMKHHTILLAWVLCMAPLSGCGGDDEGEPSDGTGGGAATGGAATGGGVTGGASTGGSATGGAGTGGETATGGTPGIGDGSRHCQPSAAMDGDDVDSGNICGAYVFPEEFGSEYDTADVADISVLSRPMVAGQPYAISYLMGGPVVGSRIELYGNDQLCGPPGELLAVIDPMDAFCVEFTPSASYTGFLQVIVNPSSYAIVGTHACPSGTCPE